ncbi:4419_t:CDS:2, partial [Funneliformis mosseae]
LEFSPTSERLNHVTKISETIANSSLSADEEDYIKMLTGGIDDETLYGGTPYVNEAKVEKEVVNEVKSDGENVPSGSGEEVDHDFTPHPVEETNDDSDWLLSLEEYLSCAPSYSPYGTISTSSTNAVGNPPDKVMIWKDFLASVNNYTFDQDERKFEKPIFIKDFITTNEEIVRQAVNVNVCLPLNRVVSDFKFTMRNVSGTGDPDFVCHKKDGDELILALEIKRVHILNHIESDQTLPKVYEEDAKVKQVIQQLYNYLSENQLKYGALSTYNHSWFVKRDHRYLCISESLEYNSTHPPVLKTYAYLAQQAIDNGHNSPHANIIPQTDDSQHNLRKRRYDPSSKQPSPGKSQRPSSSSKGSSSSTSGKTSGKQA